MESNPKKKGETKKENKFEWADEGVSTLVRVIILGWSAAILTLNYVTVPGVVPAKKKEDEKPKEEKKDEKIS